ncbi:putative MFS-type transporter protein [Lachnellula hyalina]|uniref:Putative MFS-type transporter protein n=1 Tax=Lachnellula hyalina TaxID=1316788 RepID=A0A8H8R9N4_9HELO|nr:putative MFS-type transporter protein [Lachnellula hyalina]TVY31156.1 putative MFS-type transporter protein [Lachnellula hyalina]
MVFMGLTNPFHKTSVDDYKGVVVPLSQAIRHPTVAAEYARRNSGRPSLSDGSSHVDDAKKDNDRASKDNDDGVMTSNSLGYSPYTIEGLRAEISDDMALVTSAEGGDSQYQYEVKSRLINKAIQDIGMGRYNWQLFALCGFGWFADNLWLQGVALTLPSLSKEFGISDTHVRYTTCSLFIGLCIGASFWGIGSDIMGRRLAFNMTLFIAGAFGIAAGAAPSWIGACGLFAALGVGVGGNLPVDGALFLEFLPNASGGLLTLLSIWWPIGQLVASLIAWAFLGGRFSNDDGWRYFVYTLGTITFCMFLARFALFHLFESPKFLLSRGRQAEAVAVVHGMAFKNRTTTWLSEKILNEIGGDLVVETLTLTPFEVVKRKLASFSGERIGPLFRDKKLGWTTGLLWFCWATMGMGYPLFNAFLPQYLSKGKGSSGGAVTANETYRNYAITSIVGVPGSILACYTVDIPYIGRKGTMAISTCLSGVFLFLFTISAESKTQLAFSSVEAFFQNIMYGVLYAYTPEVFPAPNRGTATGISSFLNRFAGLCAPIIAANIPSANPNAPVFVSGTLILGAFVAMCFLPIETRGMQKL